MNTTSRQTIVNAVMGAKIAAAMKANGGDIVKAFDEVMGEGAYMKLAGEVYSGLRAKAGL